MLINAGMEDKNLSNRNWHKNRQIRISLLSTNLDILYKLASENFAYLPNCKEFQKTVLRLVNWLYWDQNPCAKVSSFTFICTEIEAEVGSLKIIADLGKFMNFLLETHMSDLGGIQVMERYHNIIFDNNLSRFLRKHAESVKIPKLAISVLYQLVQKPGNRTL